MIPLSIPFPLQFFDGPVNVNPREVIALACVVWLAIVFILFWPRIWR